MPNLTPLELTTLCLLNRGLTYAQIAAGLGISPALARKHVLAVYAKLHVNNRLDAIRAAVALDLIAAFELTQREQKVLELIQQGCTTAQISAQLGLTSGAVRNYIAALHRKFGTCPRPRPLSSISPRAKSKFYNTSPPVKPGAKLPANWGSVTQPSPSTSNPIRTNLDARTTRAPIGAKISVAHRIPPPPNKQ